MIYSTYLPVGLGVAKILLKVKSNVKSSVNGIVLVRGSSGVMLVGIDNSKISLDVKAGEELSGCGVILVSKGVIVVPI